MEPAYITDTCVGGPPEVEDIGDGLVRLVFWSPPTTCTIEGRDSDHVDVVAKIIMSRASYDAMLASLGLERRGG
jgi:hypothetical protein